MMGTGGRSGSVGMSPDVFCGAGSGEVSGSGGTHGGVGTGGSVGMSEPAGGTTAGRRSTLFRRIVPDGV